MSHFLVYWGGGTTESFNADSLPEAFEYYYGDLAVPIAQSVSFYTEDQFETPEVEYEHDGVEWHKIGEPIESSNGYPPAPEPTPMERLGQNIAYFLNDLF